MPSADYLSVDTPGTLFTAKTGNGSSPVFDREAQRGPGAIVITSTIGATPTVTVNLMGSPDKINWFNVGYSLPATPTTVTVAAITITTAVTGIYLISAAQPWRWLRVDLTANTNVTIQSAKAYL